MIIGILKTCKTVKKKKMGAGKIAQWVKCLLWQYEGLGLNPWHLYNSPRTECERGRHRRTPGTGAGGGACRPASSESWWTQDQLRTKSVSRSKGERRRKKLIINVNSGLHVCTVEESTCTHMCKHTYVPHTHKIWKEAKQKALWLP